MEEEKVYLSDEEVRSVVTDMIRQTQQDIDEDKFDMVSFARGLQSGLSSYITPTMVNTNMKAINLNPQVGTYQEILEALQSPNTSENQIIAYGQNQYLTSTLYKRNFDYYANLLAFNLSIKPIDVPKEEYKTKAYKKDQKAIKDFLQKFDYRTEFKKAVFNMLNADIYPCMFRTDMSEDKYVLQDFPYKYAKITGEFSYGLICDYDLSFLMSGTQDIKMYPQFIRRKFADIIKNKKYRPSASLNHRTGNFAYWVQTDPATDDVFCFKFNPNFIAEIPYFASMIPDTSLGDIYRNLNMNQALASARKIVTSEWPMLKDAGTKQGDNLAIRTQTMGAMIGAIMSGLNSNGDLFNVISLPSNKIDVHQMENKNSAVYQEYLKTVSSLLGGANVLFSTQKQTSTETLMSANMDEMLVEKLYSQFNNFLNYFANRVTKKYKFDFKFSGTNLYTDKERRMKEAFEPAKMGLVSVNKIANAFGMNVFEFDDEMEFTKSFEMENMFTPLLNMYTGTSSTGGRPQVESSELSESGVATRDSGGNIEKGGNV